MRLLLSLLFVSAACAEDKPIFEGKLTELAGKGSAGEGPAWDPKLGVLTSGADGHIHRFSRDGVSSIYRKDAGTNGLLLFNLRTSSIGNTDTDRNGLGSNFYLSTSFTGGAAGDCPAGTPCRSNSDCLSAAGSGVGICLNDVCQ